VPRVLPFAGLRYAQTDLETLISPPYDVISPDEQRQLEQQSPYNAVHLELPADPADRPGSRYMEAARRVREWQASRVLQSEQRPAYYLSETSFTYRGAQFRRRDLLAALGVEPWSAGAVLPHEHTMAGPKQDRLELLRSTHLNASPIWVLYREPVAALDQAWVEAEDRPPAIDVTWRGERHRVWVVDDQQVVEHIRAAFEQGGPLYIADGHHRYETSLAFRAEADGRVPGAEATLAAVTWADDPGLLVLPTHRLLRAPGSAFSMEEAHTRWSGAFHLEYFPVWDDAPAEQVDALVQQLASSGRAGPAFGVFGLGRTDVFGLLSLRGGTPPPGALPPDRSEAWKSLDVSVLHTLLVDPLVDQIGRPRTDVLSYTRDPHAALAAVRRGEASVAFLLNATPVRSVLAVADAHDRMPEKSTYFYPKPPAGMVFRHLDDR
jgi:uncharacterized protein (DUF1015 family)